MLENRLKISGKFPALTVELDGKQLLAESISIHLNAQSIPVAVVTVPLLNEVDIDIPVEFIEA
jgi:hypothetical protein